MEKDAGQVTVPHLADRQPYSQITWWDTGQSMDVLFYVVPKQPRGVPPSAGFEKLLSLLPKEIQLAGDVDTAFPQPPLWLTLLRSLIFRIIAWAFPAATELFRGDQAEGRSPPSPSPRFPDHHNVE